MSTANGHPELFGEGGIGNEEICSLAIALVSSACATNRAAKRAAGPNAAKISQVKLGQSMDDVKRIMGHAGETTQTAIVNGVERATWTYITDYDNEMNTSVTFERGKVVEIKTTPWLGGGTYPK